MSTRPVFIRRPMKSTASALMVQTVSLFTTGEMWLICTPTLPAGCGPSKAVTVTFFACTRAADFCFTLIPRYVFAIFDKASSPVWKFASSPFSANSKSGASGLLSKAEMKIAFGVTVGSAITSYGRWRMKANIPACKRASFTCWPLILDGSILPNSS